MKTVDRDDCSGTRLCADNGTQHPSLTLLWDSKPSGSSSSKIPLYLLVLMVGEGTESSYNSEGRMLRVAEIF